jgi:small-conductance mechanosensitive channel
MLQELFEYQLISIGEYSLTFLHLFQIVLLALISWLMIFVSNRLIKRQVKSQRFDTGRGHAFFQIIKYIIVVFAVLGALDIVGVKLTLLLAGSAALLVGVGLGLQQIFNDMISGIIILFEGSVSIGDIVELDHVVGKVRSISVRTSKIESRDRIVIIVPNSKLVSDNVINWSHNRDITRFSIKVGVAYGSDVKLVMQLLVDSASGHPDVANEPPPRSRLIDFGESSLDFELLFFTHKMFDIDFIRSDIRVLIEEKFKQNNVTIPFPQRDLHLRSDFPKEKQ